MSRPPVIPIKTGATFSVALLVQLPAGTWSAACEIRQGDGVLVEALAVTLAPLAAVDAAGNTHAGLLQASSTQTAGWVPGGWLSDVRFADTSVPPVVLTSDPFLVLVEKAVTHG